MPWHRKTPSRTSADVGDGYRNVADLLLGIQADSGYRVQNGLLFILDKEARLVYGQKPDAAATGAPIAANDAIALQSDLEAAWDLAEIWVKNSTAGQVAKILLTGPFFAWRD